MTEFNIMVGDIVDLAPQKMAFAGDMDLEKAMVLEVDHFWDTLKVVFYRDDQEEDSKRFDFDNVVVANLSADRVRDIDRDYKILEIIDTIDTATNQSVSILRVAHVTKQPLETADGYIYTEAIYEEYVETFVFMGLPADELSEYIGNVKRFSFSKFKIANSVIDGMSTPAYYATSKIFEVEDIFTM